MSSSRLIAILAAVLLGLTIAGAAFGAPSASIEQVRNGLATSTTTPIPTWGTGNAGASNSHYLESHSIAYRTVMDQLPTDGTVIELIIGYNVKRSGSYAIDYLTHYQRLLPHVLFAHRDPEVFDPLAGVSGVSSTMTTAPIPVPTQNILIDPDGSGPEPAALQPSTSSAALPGAERAMTLYGGTLLDVSYVTEGDVNLATGSSETQVKVRFTADSPTAVLAWGGHIACRWDWGFNADGSPRSAGGIKGSSYHMRLVSWTFGSLGNQDRSMSTDAVYPVPTCAVSNQGPFCAGTTNTHSAPLGMESYQWTLADNSAGASIVGKDTSSSVVVFSGTTGGSYTLVLTTGASGFSKQCSAIVNVYAPVTADAGPDLAVCASAPQAQLAGVVSGGSGTWSGGAGTYSPNASTLDAVYTPTATEIANGGVTLTLTCTATGSPCPPVSDAVRITIQKAATANAGPDQTVCATALPVQLAGAIGGSASSGTWSGGAGTFSPSASVLNATYMPTAEEIAAGGVTLTLASDDPSGPCGAVSDAMRITINPAATVSAGDDIVVCASAPQAQLAGGIGGAATSATWSGGTGTYSPAATALNAVYTPSAAEITAGGVTLTLTTNDPAGPCGAVSDQVRITINRAATVNAGVDQVVCATAPAVTLAGSFGGAAGGATWSGGAGTFTPGPSALNAVYTPTAAEIAAGSVTLTLTSDDPAGPCGPVSDAMLVTINPAATVDAGADQVVCASAPAVTLAGTIGGAATSATWSGGAGTFNPKNTALNAVYTPTAAEIAAGGVTLTLTSNDPAGPCGAVNDAVHITINPAATVDAGLDQTVCATSPQVTLAGSVGGAASGATWSGGSGSFSPGASTLNAIYTPSASEIAAGGVTLTLTTNDPAGPCGAVSDQMRVTINPAATVNAGPDQRVCAGSPQVQLAGSIGGAATGATWSGGAGTFSPKTITLNAVYTPTAAEIAAGGVTLTLTSNDPTGPCPAVSDAMRITIDPVTVVNAGPDQVVCASSPQVQLAGSVSGTVTSGTWSGGAGTYNPGPSSLGAVYTPSAAEIAAGTVTLTLTSVPSSGPCPQVSDAMTITINPAATVNAGPDQIVCAASPLVHLAGSFGGSASGATWGGGGGTFSPNASTLTATYMPTAAEIAAGSVTLTLTTNDPTGPCPPVNDAVKITIDQPSVTVADRVVCSGVTPVTLCASVGRGIAPFTYRWNTGATTACITVADTGRYTVTVTDAKGCQGSGSGVYRQRDCIGMLAHTVTTCDSYQGGTGSELLSSDVSWVVKDNIITSIAPGVFFYFTKLIAPGTDFTIVIAQTKDNPTFPFCAVQQGQITLYDANCNTVGSGVETSPGQSTIAVHNAQAGQVFIACVKYSLKSLVGTYMDPSMGCHYDFKTYVNGLLVDADPDGLQIGTPKPLPSGTSGDGANGDPIGVLPHGTGGAAADLAAEGPAIEPYRPVPNPFSDGMRMAYAVAAGGERVSIRVYDLAGRLVRTLVNADETAGMHVVAWDGRNEEGSRTRNGMYFVHVVVGGQVKQVRVTFLK